MAEAAYSISSYMPITPDGKHLDPFNAKFRNIRFDVPADRQIIVDSSTENNAPGIAYMYLGDVRLWWVIIHYNGLADAMNDLKPGMKLLIPHRRSLLAFLEAQRSSPNDDTVTV